MSKNFGQQVMMDMARREQWARFVQRYPFAEEVCCTDHFKDWLEKNPRMRLLAKSTLCADAVEVMESYRIQYPSKFDSAAIRGGYMKMQKASVAERGEPVTGLRSRQQRKLLLVL